MINTENFLKSISESWPGTSNIKLTYIIAFLFTFASFAADATRCKIQGVKYNIGPVEPAFFNFIWDSQITDKVQHRMNLEGHNNLTSQGFSHGSRLIIEYQNALSGVWYGAEVWIAASAQSSHGVSYTAATVKNQTPLTGGNFLTGESNASNCGDMSFIGNLRAKEFDIRNQRADVRIMAWFHNYSGDGHIPAGYVTITDL